MNAPSVAAPTETFLLEARNICKQFSGVQVLDDVSFAVRPGSVHALMGENGAGKSTLTKILIGWHTRDSGELFVRGEATRFTEPKHALKAGISVIQQELSPVLHMSVAENIFLGREPRWGPFVDYRRLNEMARAVLGQIGLDIDPERPLAQLSLAEVQLVEIAKALSHDADIVIMDEPTSALGDHATQRLLEIIRLLRQGGKSVVYISHKLEEVFAVADEITVLRDGGLVGTFPARELGRDELIRLMIVREAQRFDRQGDAATKELLSVQNFTRSGEFEDVTLTLHEGEILGIFGLMGAGKSEFLHALFGETRAGGGTVTFGGQTLRSATPGSSRRRGLALVTEDRKKSGLMLEMSVRDNLSIASLGKLSVGGMLNKKTLQKQTDEFAGTLDVRAATLEQPIKNLSGGNQQKAILARWLMTAPRVLLLDEPTRGIDVGAKREIYRFMSEFAHEDRGIIVVSSELPEVIGVSDRIAVFRRGRLAGVVPKAQCSKESLMDLAM